MILEVFTISVFYNVFTSLDILFNYFMTVCINNVFLFCDNSNAHLYKNS